MQDLKLAREILNNENKTLVIVKNGEVIYSSEFTGIKPLFLAYRQLGKQMEGASCADKIVGYAAGSIYKEAKIKALYSDVIREQAKDMLEQNQIQVVCVQAVEYIQNRDKTGMCPVETLVNGETNFDVIMEKIEQFLKKINAI